MRDSAACTADRFGTPRPPALESIELREVLTEIACDRKRRLDQPRSRPDRAIELVREYFLGAVRVPVGLGGGGYSEADLYELLIRLSEADPDVPHILRTHFRFVEEVVRDRDQLWISRIVGGHLIGGLTATTRSEPGVPARDVRLTRYRNRYRLNGRTLYSTGSWYSDYLIISAVDEFGGTIRVIVPAHRAGIVHSGGWDSIDHLASGGITVLRDVAVNPDEFVRVPSLGVFERRPDIPLQMLQHAVAAGIFRALVAESAEALRTRPERMTSRDDPITSIGRLSMIAYFSAAAIRAAADAHERAAVFASDFGEESEELEYAAALEVFQVRVGVEEIVRNAISELSSVPATRTLERHWGNLRTLLTRISTTTQTGAIGDVIVNRRNLRAAG